MLPCKWSMMEEKRLVTASRRPSSADGRGRSCDTSSGIDDSCSFGEFEDEVSAVREGGLFEGGGGLGESAKCRVWMQILHDRQVEALAKGRLGTRRDRVAEKEAIESKKSLGTNRASGCMATLL